MLFGPEVALPDNVSSRGLIGWLVGRPLDVGPRIAAELNSGLYTSMPIFIGGVFNTTAVAAIATARHPTTLFMLWLGLELLLGMTRLIVILLGRRAQRAGRSPLIALPALLACAWAASVGFGAFISMASGDWIVGIIASVSAAGMVSGICLRNLGTPRLVAVMVSLSLLPCAAAALLSGQPVLMVISVQLPLLIVAIVSAASRLNGMIVGRMTLQEALEHSEAFNRSILESSPDYTLVLDKGLRIELCHTPQRRAQAASVIGKPWFDVLPVKSHADAIEALQHADAGRIGRLTVENADEPDRRWFDVAVSLVSDGSSRRLIVARDITHQKGSEERALWMAEHDPLTMLQNRVVLQNDLEELVAGSGLVRSRALLVLDLDNFKLINDTLGHDAGDALLCEFAGRLKRSVAAGDLVVRLGGDEFAILLDARADADIRRAAAKIFADLRDPFVHNGRTIECNASIGACLYPRDATGRSDLMKAADMALYAAKTAGRGQLKIFQNAIRNDIQTRDSTMSLARRALDCDGIAPHYQPKVRLRDGRIVGFEALLRWKDPGGRLRLPDKLRAAFEDPLLSTAISERMIDRTLGDVRRWLDGGIDFGHVAINVAAAEFRSGRFAETFLARLEAREIPREVVQIEVTETVFLGRGADHVQRALARLSRAGVRIALDDFGTGYASLAHLMQFPVDALKIDRSFIDELEHNTEAEAITKAIINLGHSLGIEIVAEGIERAGQEFKLIGLGCAIGQGYLYSKAAPPHMIAEMLRESVAKSA